MGGLIKVDPLGRLDSLRNEDIPVPLIGRDLRVADEFNPRLGEQFFHLILGKAVSSHICLVLLFDGLSFLHDVVDNDQRPAGLDIVREQLGDLFGGVEVVVCRSTLTEMKR